MNFVSLLKILVISKNIYLIIFLIKIFEYTIRNLHLTYEGFFWQKKQQRAIELILLASWSLIIEKKLLSRSKKWNWKILIVNFTNLCIKNSFFSRFSFWTILCFVFFSELERIMSHTKFFMSKIRKMDNIKTTNDFIVLFYPNSNEE